MCLYFIILKEKKQPPVLGGLFIYEKSYFTVLFKVLPAVKPGVFVAGI